MIIYPSLDIRGGKIVRLREGKIENETVFSDDPVASAQKWIDQGADWVHMVNLDGAFANENNTNVRFLDLVSKLQVNVQFAGGMRSKENIREAFRLGAKRVVVGTYAVENPQIIPELIDEFGAESICIALDARDGKVTTHGWQQLADTTPIEFGKQLKEFGVQYVLYTDVHRDGHLSGGNVQGTVHLARETGLSVIASGGISHIDEIHLLSKSKVVQGAVIGMALYEGQLSLTEALMAARS